MLARDVINNSEPRRGGEITRAICRIRTMSLSWTRFDWRYFSESPFFPTSRGEHSVLRRWLSSFESVHIDFAQTLIIWLQYERFETHQWTTMLVAMLIIHGVFVVHEAPVQIESKQILIIYESIKCLSSIFYWHCVVLNNQTSDVSHNIKSMSRLCLMYSAKVKCTQNIRLY